MAMYAAGSTGGCYSSFPRPTNGFPPLQMAADEKKKISGEALEKNITRLTLPVKRPELAKNPDGSWKDLTPRKTMSADQQEKATQRLYTMEVQKRADTKLQNQKRLEQKPAGKRLTAEERDACNERLCRGEQEKMQARSRQLQEKYQKKAEMESPRKGTPRRAELSSADISSLTNRLYSSHQEEKRARDEKLLHKYVYSKEAPRTTRSRQELEEQAQRLTQGGK